MDQAQEAHETLVCVECGAVAAQDARGWRGYLVDHETAKDEVVLFCPDCAEREFADR